MTGKKNRLYMRIMQKSREKKLGRKKFLQLKETEKLYKNIQKYGLREEAYKALLQFYIKRQKPKS